MSKTSKHQIFNSSFVFYVTYKENHFTLHFSESFQFLLYNNGQRNMICVKPNLWPKDKMSLFLLPLWEPLFLLQGWNTFPSASVTVLEELIMVFWGLTSCLGKCDYNTLRLFYNTSFSKDKVAQHYKLRLLIIIVFTSSKWSDATVVQDTL